MVRERYSNKFFRENEPFNTEDSAKRGRRNELRAIGLFEQLTEEGFFARVRRASKKQNSKSGIDLFGVIQQDELSTFPGEVHVPFQVKSSHAGVVDQREYNDRERKQNRIMYMQYMMVFLTAG